MGIRRKTIESDLGDSKRQAVRVRQNVTARAVIIGTDGINGPSASSLPKIPKIRTRTDSLKTRPATNTNFGNAKRLCDAIRDDLLRIHTPRIESATKFELRRKGPGIQGFEICNQHGFTRKVLF
jgi:hypothetical protein